FLVLMSLLYLQALFLFLLIQIYIRQGLLNNLLCMDLYYVSIQPFNFNIQYKDFLYLYDNFFSSVRIHFRVFNFMLQEFLLYLINFFIIKLIQYLFSQVVVCFRLFFRIIFFFKYYSLGFRVSEIWFLYIDFTF
ncbi:hypothetical protein IMG5_180320, partial [Ichthyophthirius multifiliis]